MTQEISGGINVQASLCSAPPTRDHTEHILPPAITMQQHVYDVSAQGGPLETQHTRFFIGSWSHRQPLPSTYQNSRFPERNQVFSINLIVFTNSICTISHSSFSE